MKRMFAYFLLLGLGLSMPVHVNAEAKSSIKASKPSDFGLLIRKVTRKLVSGLGNLEELQLKRLLVLPIKSSSKEESVAETAQVITGQFSNFLRNDYLLILSSKSDLEDVLLGKFFL